MQKMSKGNKQGETSKSVENKMEVLSNVSDGSMDYTAKQSKFTREDGVKLRRNSFKDSRYS